MVNSDSGDNHSSLPRLFFSSAAAAANSRLSSNSPDHQRRPPPSTKITSRSPIRALGRTDSGFKVSMTIRVRGLSVAFTGQEVAFTVRTGPDYGIFRCLCRRFALAVVSIVTPVHSVSASSISTRPETILSPSRFAIGATTTAIRQATKSASKQLLGAGYRLRLPHHRLLL